MRTKLLEPQLVRFALAGGGAALLNWVSGLVLNPLLGLNFGVVIAYLIGMTAAFLLTRQFVFGKSGRSAGVEYIRFGAVNVLAVLIVWAVTTILARHIFPAIGFEFFPAAVAHAVGVASPILPSYVLHRHFTFSPARKSPGSAL